MSVGSLIKLNRIRKQWNQDELAHGIISTSYLSKIENSQVEPSPEIVELLLERLGISPLPQKKADTPTVLRKLSELLIRRESQAAAELMKEIDSSNDLTNDIFYSILKIRYYVLIQKFEQCELIINSLFSKVKEFSTKEKYYFYKHCGDYEVRMHLYQSAIKKYEEALKHFDKLTLSTLERAHFNYSLAYGYSKNYQNSNVFHYISQALPLYQSLYELKHCADCHIILGISYQRLDQFKEAIVSYEKARELCGLIDYDELLGIIETNLGTVHFKQGNYQKGLSHYKKSIELKNSDPSKTITTIYSIVRECTKLNQLDTAKEWLKKGLDIVSPENPSHRPHYYLLMIYNFVLNDFHDEYEQEIKEVIIPYFEKLQDITVLCFILTTLGDFFYERKKYKKAAYYFKHANRYYHASNNQNF